MQEDFHYYATYCAAYIAGYSHEESLEIAYSAQFVDCCTITLLKKNHAPLSAATTQLQSEMMEVRTVNLAKNRDLERHVVFHHNPVGTDNPEICLPVFPLIIGKMDSRVSRTSR